MSQSLQPLSHYISFDAIPEELNFLTTPLEGLFDRLLVLEYDEQSSEVHNFFSADMVLRAKEALRLNIPGTGFALVLNPDYNPGGGVLYTDIPLSVNVDFGLIGLIRDLDLGSFSEAPREIFDRLAEFFDLTENEIVLRLFELEFNNGNDLIGVLNQYYSISIVPDINPLLSVREQVEVVVAKIGNDPILNGLSKYGFDVAFDIFVDVASGGEKLNKIKDLFNIFLKGETPKDFILKRLIPEFEATLDLNAGIEFPRSVLRPLKLVGGEYVVEEDINVKTVLIFDPGEFTFSSKEGFGYEQMLSVSFPPAYPQAEIGKTGFRIGFTSAKLDLSKDTNLPEVDADGRPRDFTGVFIEEATVTLPHYLSPSGGNSVLVGRNLIIGTGGLSGTIGLKFLSSAPTGATPSLPIPLGLDGLELEINQFSLTFQQNAIVGSTIEGTLKLPWFKQGSGSQPFELSVLVHFEQDGDFRITVKPGIPIPILRKEGVFKLFIDKLEVGREDGRYFMAVSGGLEFENIGSGIGQFLNQAVSVNNLIIWEDGEIEFKGGFNPVPRAVYLVLPPAKIAVTNIHLGEDERRKNGEIWKYTYFGFDAGLSLNPGGLDLRGDGIKLYFSKKKASNGFPADIFMRIQGINIDLYLPGSASRETATLIIKGYLRLRNDSSGNQEYLGGIDFEMPDKGIAGSATMIYQPKTPRWLVDANLSLSSPLILGTTGLGIYDFRGLFGKRYVPSKTKIGLDESARWWEYYKKDYLGGGEGIYAEKFDSKNGSTVGAGVSIATVSDGGFAFSSKVFAMFIPNGGFVIMGMAQILKKRIGLEDPKDPPFFASLAISDKEIVATLAANMALPSSGSLKGKIATVNGQAEAYFSFQDPDAWYLALGYPDNRIRTTVFGIFGMDFFLNLNAKGIAAAASAHFGFKKGIGPFKVEVSAGISLGGHINFAPVQMGGYFAIHGSASIKFWKIRWGVSIGLGMSIEAPKPFILAGYIKACKRILRKKRCVKISFKWTGDSSKQLEEVLLIDPINPGRHGKATHMLTGEQFDVLYTSNTNGNLPGDLSSGWAGDYDRAIIPMDSYIEIDLLRGVNPLGSGGANVNNLKRLGGINAAAKFTIQSPIHQGKSAPVHHQFFLDDFEIFYRDPASGGQWLPYNFYDAMEGAYDVLNNATSTANALSNMKYGFWQTEAPGLYKRLQILARTPVQFMTKSRYSELGPEHLKIRIEDLFCPPDPVPEGCVEFLPSGGSEDNFDPDIMYNYNGLDFSLTGGKGELLSNSSASALYLDPGTSMTFFPDDYYQFNLEVDSPASDSELRFYTLEETGYMTADGLPEIVEELVQTIAIPAHSKAVYSYDHVTHQAPLSKVILEVGTTIVPDPAATIGPTVAQMNDWYNLIQALATAGLFDTTQIGGMPGISFIGLKGGAGNPPNPPYMIDSTGPYAYIFDDYFFNTEIYGNPGPNTVAYMVCARNDGNLAYFIFSDNSGAAYYPYDTAQTNTGYTVGVLAWDLMHVTQSNHTLLNLGELQNVNSYFSTGWDPGVYNFQAASHSNGPGPLRITTLGAEDVSLWKTRTKTKVFTACYLGKEEAQYNAGIPSPDLELDPLYDVAELLSEPLAPVWRPDTEYAIKLTTKDYIYSGSYQANHVRYHYFGFRTKGPIGHFHIYPDNTQTHDESYHDSYLDLINDPEKNPDSYRLDELTDYIDFANSYPDFKGKIAQVKPRYFTAPTIFLRFKEMYMSPLYRNWDAYGAKPQVQSDLEFVIIDPALESVTGSPHSVVEWKEKEAVRLPLHLQHMVSMIQNGALGSCVTASLIVPKVMEPEIVIQNLKPNKLYTVSLQARFNDGVNAELTREVYRFVMETSRFADFSEHINSLNLVEDATGVTPKSNTNVVMLPEDATQFGDFFNYLGGTVTAAMKQQYPDKTDLILQGILQQNDLFPDERVSATLICMNRPTGIFLLGVLIQSPEPIYDHQIDEADALAQIDLSLGAQITTANIKKFISKDFSRIFIAPNANNLPAIATAGTPITVSAQFDITEWVYDGTQFDTGTQVTTNILFNL